MAPDTGSPDGIVPPQISDEHGSTDIAAPLASPPTTTAAPATADEPRCSQEHILACQFSRWYPVFKHCTPRSVVVDLSEDITAYLQQDGVVLPKGFDMACERGLQEDSDDEVDWDEDEDDDDQRPDFPGLHTLVSDAIASLGGSVFPKLNWSCPQDAAWVNDGTLKCSLAGDVLCLLKSSTFISHDLNHAFDKCVGATITRPERFTLVLRKWCNLHPSMLFRCFVRERRLIGVSQRDCTSYYSFLEEDADRLAGLLEDFFAQEVCKKFPDPNCVADVYIDSRSRVWLLDINPFSAVTDSLLFDWSEDVLAAPLPPAATPQEEEETLPPGVFMRLYLEPPLPSASAASATGDSGPEAAGDSSDVDDLAAVVDPGTGTAGHRQNAEENSEQVQSAISATPEGVGSVSTGSARGDRGFDFRCVPSSLHMVPDPMGRYRGPADVGMGTLVGGPGGEGGLEDLIETCRLAESGD